jgi:hypothetical protein
MPAKKPYQKPKLEQVSLIPEEAVLTACKANTGIGGKSDRCPPTSTGCKTDFGS